MEPNNNYDDGVPVRRTVTLSSGTMGVDEENSFVESSQPTSDGGADNQSNNNSNSDGQPRQRRPFVSRHRKALDHIRSDAIESRRHQVPDPVPMGGASASEVHDLLNGNEEQAYGSNNDGQHATPARSMSQNFESWVIQSTIIKNQFQKYFNKQRESFSRKKPLDWLDTMLPMSKWMRSYDFKNTFTKDLVAGLTVGVMIVPQSMSYAKLAGLPVEYGLYSALMPVFAYSFFGTSRQLAVGPVALISLLLSTGLDSILSSRGVDEQDSSYDLLYAQIAVQISFLVGVTNIAMGLLQLGFVTIFLSHAVISGTFITRRILGFAHCKPPCDDWLTIALGHSVLLQALLPVRR